MKKLSIVIITLNEEKRIWRILQNLRLQTFQDYEIIIVDSDSDDNTAKEALKYQDQFEEFLFVNMEARGVSKGRNTWGKLAKYENILFLDADTLFSENFLKNFLWEIEKRKLESWTAQLSGTKTTYLYKLWFFIMNMGMKITQYFSPTWVWACLFAKKYVFDEIWGFDERINLCEDCEFLKRSKQNWFKFWVLKEKFYFDFRRLDQEGLYKTYFKYLRANFHRFTRGELINTNKYDYNFWHYK
jgi:glycosyltransferase involved in cell wall biosynthesis